MNKNSLNKMLFSGVLLLPMCFAHAQGTVNSQTQIASKIDWYFGAGLGFRLNDMGYSNLGNGISGKGKMKASGVFSIFGYGEFGEERNFGIRPQLSYLNRGGKLSNMQLSGNDTQENKYEDMSYTLNAHYLDLRIPLIFNFGYEEWRLRPYAYVAPVFGLATGGKLKLQYKQENSTSQGQEISASKANLKSTYFAGQIGVGAKYAIPLAHTTCFVGLEVSYEHGFTDTYAQKEKNGEVINVSSPNKKNSQVSGSRRFSGFEIQALLSLPFDLLAKPDKKPKEPTTTKQVQPASNTVVYMINQQVDKPCYTLDEIDALIAKNQSVVGKTICAIDDVTFEFGKSTITPASYPYLNRLARTIIRTGKRVQVKGHTDNIGADELNLKLSCARAQAVVEYLVGQGVSRNKLFYDYFGKTRPISTNTTPEGRARNRRVEFTILDN